MNVSFIYGLFDPETEELCYIGRTDNLERRLKEHCNWKISGNDWMKLWIASLLSVKMLPKISIIYQCYSNINIDQIEIDLIREYWRAGHPLLNLNGVKNISFVSARISRIQNCKWYQNRL